MDDKIRARMVAHQIAVGCIYKESHDPSGLSRDKIPDDLDAQLVYDALQTLMRKLSDIAQKHEMVIAWGEPTQLRDDDIEAG